MKYLHKTNHFKKSTTKKPTRKECGAFQKMVDIAKSREYTMQELLAYDITGNSPLFGDDGHNELWFPWFQAIGRYIPIHKLALKLGADFCKVTPAVHALTGCDYSSKAGTKAAALKANPVVYLKCFGSFIQCMISKHRFKMLNLTCVKSSKNKQL